jgi:hypothetical protein
MDKLGILGRQRVPRRAEQVEKLRRAALTILHAGCDGQTKSEFESSLFRAVVDNITIKLRAPSFWLHAYSIRQEYLTALSMQTDINFVHGMDIWAPNKVLNIEWDSRGDTEIVSFRRGAWEQSLLAEARRLREAIRPASHDGAAIIVPGRL